MQDLIRLLFIGCLYIFSQTSHVRFDIILRWREGVTFKWIGSVPFDHSHSQQPVPRSFPLLKRCE